MSKKMNFEEWAERESIVFTTYVHYARRSWNFCASQYESEVKELKEQNLLFAGASSLALKNQKSAIELMEEFKKENEELKKKLEESVLIIEDLCSSVEECQERAKAKAFLEGVKGG